MDSSALGRTTCAATNHIHECIRDTVDDIGNINEEIDDSDNDGVENLGEYV